MSISILNSYNPYIKTNENIAENNKTELKEQNADNNLIRKLSTSQVQQLNTKSEDLISQKEREYFIKLFPENYNSLQKHIVFNRNGKLNTLTINKGVILDGKV
jgi:hypothetical protein